MPGRCTETDAAASAEIGARIKARRLLLGMSQGKLADKLGVTFQQVQKYESGRNRVSAPALVRLAEKLDTSVTDLLGLNDEPAPVSDIDRECMELLRAYRALHSESQRAAVRSLLRTLNVVG